MEIAELEFSDFEIAELEFSDLEIELEFQRFGNR